MAQAGVYALVLVARIKVKTRAGPVVFVIYLLGPFLIMAETPEIKTVSAELPVEIVYPLNSRLLELLFEGEEVRAADDLSTSLSEDIVAALNRRLAEAECLHELHHNFVLGLGPSVAAKIGPSLDVDHLSNLRYVNSRVPDTPTPQCLGAFRNGHQSYFFLSRAPGVTLESVWPDLTTAHKLSVQSQLNSIFRALRAQAPDGQENQLRLGSFETGICKDTRRMERVCEKPIRTEANLTTSFVICLEEQ